MKKLSAAILLSAFIVSLFPSVSFGASVFTDVLSAAPVLAATMENTGKTVSFDYFAEGVGAEDYEDVCLSLFEEITDAAFVHTRVPTQGDYLRYTYNEMHRTATVGLSAEGCEYGITFDLTYFVTPEQEKELTEKLDAVMPELISGCKNDYETVRAIHDHICDRVSYDKAGLADESNTIKYTAYAAAVNGKSVCEGYSLLFYRMCLLAGIDCRVADGIGLTEDGPGDHSWNIVNVGGRWYNIDCTWDDTTGTDLFFLRGSENFSGHISESYYLDEGYAAKKEDFIPGVSPVRQALSRGDADGSGKIDVKDARAVLRCAIKLDYCAPYSFEFAACDTDADGVLTVTDARSVLRAAIGLETL